MKLTAFLGVIYNRVELKTDVILGGSDWSKSKPGTNRSSTALYIDGLSLEWMAIDSTELQLPGGKAFLHILALRLHRHLKEQWACTYVGSQDKKMPPGINIFVFSLKKQQELKVSLQASLSVLPLGLFSLYPWPSISRDPFALLS